MTHAPSAVPSFFRGNVMRGVAGGVANRALASRIQTLAKSLIHTTRQISQLTFVR